MWLPCKVTEDLGLDAENAFRFRFADPVRRNTWRRHQCRGNAPASGWRSDRDARRRLLTFRDRYTFSEGCLKVEDVFLHLAVLNERGECEAYLARCMDALRRGRWTVKGWHATKCDLECFVEVREPIYDLMWGSPPPNGYAEFQLVVQQSSVPGVNAMRLHRAYHIFKTAGVREVPRPGVPLEAGLEDLADFLPAQLEIGCGPSVECGIPPLRSLHALYGVSGPGGFVFSADEDPVPEVLAEPEAAWRRFAAIHAATLTCGQGAFYRHLPSWYSRRNHKLVGPVITNNFDAMVDRVAVTNLRDFDKWGTYPPVEFHPDAKSLIAVGIHADRRHVQAQARRLGLRVVHVNPEGYQTDAGFAPCPLESPQDRDVLIRCTAGEFAHAMNELARRD